MSFSKLEIVMIKEPKSIKEFQESLVYISNLNRYIFRVVQMMPKGPDRTQAGNVRSISPATGHIPSKAQHGRHRVLFCFRLQYCFLNKNAILRPKAKYC